MTDTTTALTPLERLHAEAAERRWEPEIVRKVATGRWRPAEHPDDAEWTIKPPDDHLGMATIRAHTARGDLYLRLNPPVDMAAAVNQLIDFLEWHDSGEEAAP